jgi:hypothetical protein
MKRYTKEQREWLDAFIPGHKADEIVEAYNEKFHGGMTASKVKSYKKNHHVPSGTMRGKPAGLGGPVWTKEICSYLVEINHGKSAQETADAINARFHTNFSRMQIKGIRARLHLKSGLTGRFDKNHVPPNKGRKGYHSPGSEKGWFKKGQRSWNHAEVGAEAWTTDGYLKVKIAEPNKWRQKHILVWEKHNGPIPEGFMVTFKDQDHANCSIENLALISKSENAIMNVQGLRSEDPKLTETGILLARLKHKVSQAEKQ